MMLQLNPPVPLVTPKGKGDAHLVIDYGPEHNLLWVVFLRDSGECWTYTNQLVRLEPNETLRPTKSSANGHAPVNRLANGHAAPVGP